VANYNTTDEEAWVRYTNFLVFNHLLIFVSLRDYIKKLISSYLYRITVYIIVNNFADRCFGIKDWSWNDTLTVVAIVVEYVVKVVNWKNVIDKLTKFVKNKY
jgi:hypothetical protein